MSKLTELRGQINERREKLHEVFEQAGDDFDMDKITSLEGDSAAKVEVIRAMNNEISELSTEAENLDGLAGIRSGVDALGDIKRPPLPTGARNRAEEKAETRSIGHLFTEHEAFQKAAEGHMGPEAHFDVDVKATLFATGAGWTPPTQRGPVVVDFAVRPLMVADLLPSINVSLPTYLYMEETTFTNAAAEVAEGSAKPEAALALTERTENIRKVAVYLPVTDEQLEDVPAARQYIDNRLGYMVKQRLDGQILVGDGVPPNLAGITDDSRTGLQTQAAAGAGDPDGVYKAMTKIRVNAFSEPNAAVFHPNDWQDFRLLRTADGIYIWGNPADDAPERIFGLRVVQTVAMTQNTALVGDFNQAALLLRQGLTMKVGYVNDDLIKNRQTVVAELRAGVAVYRPAAFCTVTGL